MQNKLILRALKCSALAGVTLVLFLDNSAAADVLCKDKKTGALSGAKTSCSKGKSLVSSLSVTTKSSSSKADEHTATRVGLQNTGAVASGSDTSTGLDVLVTRTGAVGGTFNNIGLNLDVSSDGAGDATNVGLYVTTAGADNNYCAIFQGGNVGIGVSDPDEQLELTGRIHMGQSSAPSDSTDKLYNLSGTLYWSGQQVALGSVSSGITSVIAGTGLSGGGSSGAVTLNVNAGTSANNIVQLNSSGELPAVSGANLTALNASSLASGSISDSLLSANVSLLGNAIALSSSEVSGILPIANGGTGASSLANLITLGTHTTGNYVASVGSGTGISGGASGSEGAALTLSVDQSFSPTWTGTHSFQGAVNVGTSTASVEALHLNGRLQLEQTSAPSTTTDKLYNVAGSLYFNGQNISAGAAGGDVTGITAGTGINVVGSSGDITVSVDTGTSAGDIVQLNGSAQIPAISGALLTNLNATNLSSGTISDSRLSGNVSLLGSDVSLSSEVTGVLPVANGGIGASSLSNLITLGTHTTGNYVATLAAGTGVLVTGSGTESAAVTVSLDQTVAPTWSNTHTFSGVLTDITTATNENFCIVPNGTGSVGIGTTNPSAKLDTVFTSTSASAGTETGDEFNFTDTGVVSSGTDISKGVDIVMTRTGATGGTITSTGLSVSVTGDTGGTSTATGLAVSVQSADTNIAATFSGGSVGIGDTVSVASSNVPSGSLVIGNGTLCVDNSGDNCDDSSRTAGTIYANATSVSGVDVAENFPIQDQEQVEAGELVSINSQVAKHCISQSKDSAGHDICTRTVNGIVPFVIRATDDGSLASRRKVLGVVSTEPGVLLGGYKGEQLNIYKKVPVALKGRVPVKVCLENGPIEPGDRITLSSTPGVGMRAATSEDPSIVGIALESFGSDDGQLEQGLILVLVK
ncbi:MAG: hypothetical protein K1X79_06840 [Oligoflexia bacterium]|nr:hypothetical protein [Oligoflexia bacterium]